MKLFTLIKNHFSPRILETVASAYNGSIQVADLNGNLRFMVGGYVQSGGFVEKLWQRTLNHIQKTTPAFHPHTAAIFGFAGGSAGHVIHENYPDLTLTAVDIDPVIIALGKKYFQTYKIAHLKIVIADVFAWIQKNDLQFDLIIIDLFQGGKIPAAAASANFIQNLHRSLSAAGIIAVNYFPHHANLSDMHRFDRLVREYFSQIEILSMFSEKVYLLKK